jgi:hypothetical protein
MPGSRRDKPMRTTTIVLLLIITIICLACTSHPQAQQENKRAAALKALIGGLPDCTDPITATPCKLKSGKEYRMRPGEGPRQLTPAEQRDSINRKKLIAER